MSIYKYIFTFVIVPFNLASAWGQAVVFPVIRDLKGNVRSIKEVCYKAEIKDGKTIKGAELKKSNYLLDTKNKLLEKNDYDSTGGLIERYVANYDDNENIIEETQYTPDSVLNKLRYRYDNKGNRIAWMSFTMVDTAIARGSYHYDAKGRIIVDSLFDAKGRMAQYDAYAFDEENHPVKDEHFTIRGNKTVDIYELDMDGRRIQDTKTGADGNTQSMLRYKYNNDDRLIQIDIFTDSSEDYLPLEKTKYDNAGNKTEDTRFISGKIVSREVISYDSLNAGRADAFYDTDGIALRKSILKFDAHRNKTEEDTYKLDTLYEKVVYTYDDKKNKTEINCFKGTAITKTQIVYDGLGNPVKETIYLNNQPVSIIERELVYY